MEQSLFGTFSPKLKEPVVLIWSVTVQVLGYRVESYIYKDPRNAFIISYNPPGRPQ